MIYRLPALTTEHEFSNLTFVQKYAESLISDTGNRDFGVVHEWKDTDDQGEFIYLVEGAPPDAVFLYIASSWVRRRVIATPRADGDFDITFV